MVAAGLGTSVLARWAVDGAIADGRVSASRVGAEGITIQWHAFYRPDDSDAKAIAEMLADWCAQTGFGSS